MSTIALITNAPPSNCQPLNVCPSTTELNSVTATGSKLSSSDAWLGPSLPIAMNSPVSASGNEMHTPQKPIQPLVFAGSATSPVNRQAAISTTLAAPLMCAVRGRESPCGNSRGVSTSMTVNATEPIVAATTPVKVGCSDPVLSVSTRPPKASSNAVSLRPVMASCPVAACTSAISIGLVQNVSNASGGAISATAMYRPSVWITSNTPNSSARLRNGGGMRSGIRAIDNSTTSHRNAATVRTVTIVSGFEPAL